VKDFNDYLPAKQVIKESRSQKSGARSQNDKNENHILLIFFSPDS